MLEIFNNIKKELSKKPLLFIALFIISFFTWWNYKQVSNHIPTQIKEVTEAINNSHKDLTEAINNSHKEVTEVINNSHKDLTEAINNSHKDLTDLIIKHLSEKKK